MEANDATKLRKALLAIHEELRKFVAHEIDETSLCLRIKNLIKEALAAPPRKCDVGTAEEQYKRRQKFCRQHYNPEDVDAECWRCLVSVCESCELTRAQMPYTEET